jgi:hypothetical protein
MINRAVCKKNSMMNHERAKLLEVCYVKINYSKYLNSVVAKTDFTLEVRKLN